jgi:hypothetical protein
MIRYHGTPFSGDTTTRLALRGRHAMVSFARPDDLELVAELCQSFALDNGAFTSWTQGKQVDADAYLDWARLWLKHPGCDWALIPDVIDGDEEANDAWVDDVLEICGNATEGANFEQWVPVWHLHESLGRLERLALAWPRVAFGSSGQYAEVSSPAWWQRMAEALDRVTDADGMPKCKLHGLRMLDSVVFAHVPFSSADSTNVARNIGIDDKWRGPYVPATDHQRALVMIDRIESHASARRWNRETAGSGWNRDLLG